MRGSNRQGRFQTLESKNEDKNWFKTKLWDSYHNYANITWNHGQIKVFFMLLNDFWDKIIVIPSENHL